MIGEGVYHLNEAARYAGIPTETLRSWFKIRSDGVGQGPLFASDFSPEDGDYAISFLNLIEAYVARFFKNEGVKAPIIRRAHEILKSELETTHPFAHEDLRTDGRAIIQSRATKNDSLLVDVVSKQHFFPQMRLGRITYSGATHLAEVWHIAQDVVINPAVSFGKPVVENSSAPTLLIARQYLANHRDASLVARLYRLTENSVKNAYEFERGLRRVAA